MHTLSMPTLLLLLSAGPPTAEIPLELRAAIESRQYSNAVINLSYRPAGGLEQSLSARYVGSDCISSWLVGGYPMHVLLKDRDCFVRSRDQSLSVTVDTIPPAFLVEPRLLGLTPAFEQMRQDPDCLDSWPSGLDAIVNYKVDYPDNGLCQVTGFSEQVGGEYVLP